jgi:hypothetical protein
LPPESEPRQRAPYLPSVEGLDWHPMTRRWWRDVWGSPMATEYVRADEHGLFRLAILINEFWGQPTAKLAAEIRLQQQAYGLTPLDRRRLEWSVEQVEEAKEKREQKRARRARIINGDDPRTILS